ncbi:MAG: hypothetical protein JST86_04315 [Bacteroidetes bacterium]|nr:hypothetical protein [Bacteroidota bacterium]
MHYRLPFSIHRMLLLCAFICLHVYCVAQKPRVYIGYPFTVTNLNSDKVFSGSGYATDTGVIVDMRAPVIYDQFKKMFPASKLSYILKYSLRENWPVALTQVSDWKTLEEGSFYYVCEFTYRGEYFTLIEMPAAENQKLPAALRPATDIYLVAGAYLYYNTGHWTDKKNVKKLDYLNAFKQQVKNRGWVDSTLYFTSTIPVAAVTRADMEAQYAAHQEILAVEANTKKLNDAMDYLEKQKREAAEKQHKTDSINTIINSLMAEMKALNEPLLNLYRQGKTDELLIAARTWKTKSFNSNETRPRPANDLRGPVTLHFLESNVLSFSTNYSKGGLDMTGSVTIYVRDEEPANINFGSRTLNESFMQRISKAAAASNKYISAGDKHGVLMWDLSGTPLAASFNDKIKDYKNEAMCDEFTVGLTADNNIVYLSMPTQHFTAMTFMQAEVFELAVRIAALTKTRDGYAL